MSDAIQSVVSVVAGHYGITPEDLRSEERGHPCQLARREAIYAARHLTGCTFARIGGVLDRSESNVCRTFKAVVADRAHSPAYDTAIDALLWEARSILGSEARSKGSSSIGALIDRDRLDRLEHEVGRLRETVTSLESALQHGAPSILPPSAANAVDPERHAALVRAARETSDARRRLENDRFSPGERSAQARLDRALGTLSTTLEKELS